jgi:hypothetical protein
MRLPLRTSEPYSKRGNFLDFSYNFIFNTAPYAAPRSDSTVSDDAGIEPRAVATLGLAVWGSNHTARSNPLQYTARSHPLIRLDLIQNSTSKTYSAMFLNTMCEL